MIRLKRTIIEAKLNRKKLNKKSQHSTPSAESFYEQRKLMRDSIETFHRHLFPPPAFVFFIAICASKSLKHQDHFVVHFRVHTMAADWSVKENSKSQKLLSRAGLILSAQIS